MAYDFNLINIILEFTLTIFSVFTFKTYFDAFFEIKKKKIVFVIFFLLFLQEFIFFINEITLAGYTQIIFSLVKTIIVVDIAYKGKLRNICIFSFVYNALGMTCETLCGYIIIIYFNKFMLLWFMGAFLSKLLLLLIILTLTRRFSEIKNWQLSIFPSIVLVLIPIGSMYITNYIFMTSIKYDRMTIGIKILLITVLLITINILFFYIYFKFVNNLYLKQCNTLYKRQFQIIAENQIEREKSILQIRDVKHNMKNTLISILSYAEDGKNLEIVDFVNEIISNNRLNSMSMATSGNIIVDSLINFWYSVAKDEGIDFSFDLSIPILMKFQNSDMCLILGNLLENSIEATQKVSDGYIRLQMKYDNGNLLIFLVNNYNGKLFQTKDGRIKTSKIEMTKHGIGIESIKRTVKKYNGLFLISHTSNEFITKILLYNPE